MKYAILWDIDSENSFPCGLAVEKSDRVELILPEKYMLYNFYDTPIFYLDSNMIKRWAKPGEERYFDEVLLDLSRPFAIGEIKEYDNG